VMCLFSFREYEAFDPLHMGPLQLEA